MKAIRAMGCGVNRCSEYGCFAIATSFLEVAGRESYVIVSAKRLRTHVPCFKTLPQQSDQYPEL